MSANPLLEWYDENGRHELPWREEERPAFEVLVAEVLLQRTTATAVCGAYVPLVFRYPTPEAIVAAPSGEIRDLIAPLDLSKRAAYLERFSGQLLDRQSGQVLPQFFPSAPCPYSSPISLRLYSKASTRKSRNSSEVLTIRPPSKPFLSGVA